MELLKKKRGKNMVRVVYKEPLKDPIVRYVKNDADTMGKLVKGNFEMVLWEKVHGQKYFMLVNYAGKINGMELNFSVWTDRAGFAGRYNPQPKLVDRIAGPVIWTRTDIAGNFIDLDQWETDFILEYLGYGDEQDDDIIVGFENSAEVKS